MTELNLQPETQIEKYEKILDNLLKMSGGKEYCLRQIMAESDYKKFSRDFIQEHKNEIYNKISERFYKDCIPFNESNIISIEISNTCWNKYIMKLYFYDKVNFKLFEYYVKTDNVENVSLFDDDDKIFAKSFFTKIRNGNSLWEDYQRFINKEEHEREIARLIKHNNFFEEKKKMIKYLNPDEFEELKAIKAPDQYGDGCIRYLANNNYYYFFGGIDGYLTFQTGDDLLLSREFAALFYKKCIYEFRKKTMV